MTRRMILAFVGEQPEAVLAPLVSPGLAPTPEDRVVLIGTGRTKDGSIDIKGELSRRLPDCHVLKEIVESEYRRVRNAPSKDWSAGVHVLLAPMPWPAGPLAFQTGGFFTMEESEFGRLQFPDKPAWPEAVRPFYKGAADEWYSAMLRFEAVPLTPADFTCDRVLARAGRRGWRPSRTRPRRPATRTCGVPRAQAGPPG